MKFFNKIIIFSLISLITSCAEYQVNKKSLEIEKKLFSSSGFALIYDESLYNGRIDLLISDEEIANRKKNIKIPKIKNQTPWQEISRSLVGQLETGACLETESVYLDITNTKGMPRHSH